MKILFIQTGGTIDKDYENGRKAYLFEITDPAVLRIMKRANPNFKYEVVELAKKDSLDLTDADRKKIYNYCLKSKEERIVITHGTDTMDKTAKVLAKIPNKTIVFTGASRPERFTDSDADFNLGCAVASVQTLPHGVYVAMSGRVYTYDSFKKAVDGQFVDKK